MMFTKWYRWKDTNPLTVTFNQWYEWQPLPKNREREILDYIELGHAYQIATVEAVRVIGHEVDLLHVDPMEIVQ